MSRGVHNYRLQHSGLFAYRNLVLWKGPGFFKRLHDASKALNTLEKPDYWAGRVLA